DGTAGTRTRLGLTLLPARSHGRVRRAVPDQCPPGALTRDCFPARGASRGSAPKVSPMRDVVMPRLSASMEQGTILRWLKSDGDRVRAGDELVEIETDKATETYEVERDGVLQLVAAVGETLPVGAVIARLDGAAAAPAPPAPAPATSPPVSARGETTVVEATRAEGAIARRAAESRATIPDFTATLEVDATAALEACAQLAGALDPAPI